jgi:hypothetical protein
MKKELRRHSLVKGKFFKNYFPLLLMFAIVAVPFVFDYVHENKIAENEGITVAVTYTSNPFGSGGTVFYFFKVSSGIYKGSASKMNLKVPGGYYKVRFSRTDPGTNEILRDSIVPDSIGIQFIRLDDIDPNNYMNIDDYK